MAVWLVTGGSGFLGRHLLAELAASPPPGAEVVALGRRCPPAWPLEAFVHADLEDSASLSEALGGLQPAVVLHAAGLTPPSRPEQLYRANTLATVQLLAALKSLGRPVRVVLAGSAAELGPVAVDDLPVSESYRARPVDAYGLSKWFATAAGLRCEPPLEVMVGRVFNPIGPGMPRSQAFGRFAELLAATGPDPVCLAVGDLDHRRDFVDIRDVARALIMLALRGHPGLVSHIGTGRSRRVGEGLERLIALSGRAVIVEASGSSRGPQDSRADVRRLTEQTGWSPSVSWEQSLADLWDEVRARPVLTLTTAPSSV
ncbi:MAG TPA: NAD(P)-dependent oxidoreductase [Isosphaeraceae bacterium]|jgi:GDP-4-dehydro-6-deoxy-D-mannose reductase|nr:NAD(P)-dependent oxidoreductase [Isosphaeraceae bacterium]